MSSKATTRPITITSGKGASERFAAVLRTAPIAETMKTRLRHCRHALFGGDGRLLWATTFKSDWHRYLGRTATQIALDSTGK
jgi:hypothetical protein